MRLTKRKTYQEQYNDLPAWKKSDFMEAAKKRQQAVLSDLRKVRNYKVLNCVFWCLLSIMLADAILTFNTLTYDNYIILIGSLSLTLVFVIRNIKNIIIAQSSLRKSR